MGWEKWDEWGWRLNESEGEIESLKWDKILCFHSLFEQELMSSLNQSNAQPAKS